MVATTTTEFPIDLDSEAEGLGTLIVTDAQLLVRPRVPGQYRRFDHHDSSHAYGVLCLGNDGQGLETTHIVYSGSPAEAHKLLDRVFHCFVDSCCLELGCDARAIYVVAGETVHAAEYGWDDGSYTMTFIVHCEVPEDQAEAFVDQTIAEAEEDQCFVVVRPDSSELGYAAQGIIAGHSQQDDPEDDFDEPYDEAEEDLCEGGCGQPARYCVCAEMDSLRRYESLPMEEREGPWTA
jgi:hypothetical protein